MRCKWIVKADIVAFLWAVIPSVEMYSMIQSIQWMVWQDSFDFHFRKIIFLARGMGNE